MQTMEQQVPNISPATTNSYQFDITNQPLPPTPISSHNNFDNVYKQTSGLQSQPSTSSAQQFQNNQSNIVGPSDHYGSMRHQPIQQQQQQHNPSNSKYQQGETKVCVIVDSRTPVIFKIPLPPTRITLADLKSALPAINQTGYKYFFKSNDKEFGIVKEEIQDDDNRLPTYRNRVVAWIVTPSACLNDDITSSMTNKSMTSRSDTDTCNLTYSNTSYTCDDGSSSLMTATDVDSTSYFTETDDDDSISCSNYSATTCDTFISQRRSNRHPNNNISDAKFKSINNINPYRNNGNINNSSPYRYNSQQHVRNLHDNLSQSSQSSSSTTSSSASQSDATAVHCLTVHLVLTNENFLGLHIYANAINDIDEGIYVDGVTENSAVALDGRIEPGDKLIQVNETNLEELSNEEAVKVLKEAVIKRGPLKLVVAKFVETNKNDQLDGIIGARDAIHPIDTAAWVAHAQAITIPNSHLDQTNSATSSPSFGSNAQDTDCIRPASANFSRMVSGLRLSKGTTDIKEIIHHMKLPEIGLDIRDREWLKISIPRAFLGSDLVTWLERNVYGFNNNHEAKKFAGRMLKDGYIRDPISKKSFSSKSYYTFVQS